MRCIGLVLLGLLFFMSHRALRASLPGPSLPPGGVIKELKLDSFFDPTVDYAHFPGRVTDRDQHNELLKIKAETHNVKFFKAADQLSFTIHQSPQQQSCQGQVRNVEGEGHFTVVVDDIFPCLGREQVFRRGMVLHFSAPILKERIQQASAYRRELMAKREAYLQKLNEFNKYIWSFDELKMQKAASFDQRILAIEKEKQRALEQLLARQKQVVREHHQLNQKIDEVDRDLLFYRVEKDEYLADRWALDHDLGKPVMERPQALRPMPAAILEKLQAESW